MQITCDLLRKVTHMKAQSNNTRSIKLFAFVLGFIISGMILFEGLINHNAPLSATRGEYDSLKNEIQHNNEIEYNKTLLTNSYLLGVSIYKLKESLD